MADEIYINIGSSFQQPYQGQTPTQAQSAETKQIVKQTPANIQTLIRVQVRLLQHIEFQ